MTLQELASRKSPAKAKAVDSKAAADYLKALNGWGMKGKEISKTYSFKNYYETMGFVNAIAYIANKQDHHPDLEVGYNKCTVKFSTHSVGGLSENDFICAAKVQGLTST
jgi:4a-hydroxytetrahydrobiopterin dehydratase